MDNSAVESDNRPPATNPDTSLYPPSGNENEAVKSPVNPESQPPPYTEQQHYGAGGQAPYPTEPAKHPIPQAYPTQLGPYPTQPGAYPTQQPAAYPQHAGPYPQQQPGAYAPQQAGAMMYTSTNTVVVTQPGIHGNVIYGGSEIYPNNVGAIVFSCCVYWCCCCLLGLPAFILAVMSSSSESSQKARQFLNISYGLSIAGLCIGIFFWVLAYAL